VSGRLGRLAAAFPDARLVEVEGGHTFLPLDEPGRVASEISTFLVPAGPCAHRWGGACWPG
jgi:hypothetical protein